MIPDTGMWNEIVPGTNADTLIAGSNTLRGQINGPGRLARFSEITDICVDLDNILLICDFGNNVIRFMDLTPPYTVETMCGNGAAMNVELLEARFQGPRSICIDGKNNIYISDHGKNCIHKINSIRENMSVFFDNSMVLHSYYGDAQLMSRCVMNRPSKLRIQNNKHLIVLNNCTNTIFKISLTTTQYQPRIWCSIVKYDLPSLKNFDVAENGDIFICGAGQMDCVSFYKILSDGTQVHLAELEAKNGQVIGDMQIRSRCYPDLMCFDTMHQPLSSLGTWSAMTRVTFKMKWELLRILFIACLKPDANYTEDYVKTFELLPTMGRDCNYCPILRIIVDFVNNVA
jgi:hypothetical protein